MADLIAFLSNDKGIIAHVDRVIKGMKWGKVYVLTNEDSLNYDNDKCEVIKLDNNKTISAHLILQRKASSVKRRASWVGRRAKAVE